MTTRPVSPELVEQLRDTATTAIASKWVANPATRGGIARGVVEALLPAIASVDENAHQRGRAEGAVTALRFEADWLETAHRNSADKGYPKLFRDGFACAAGWVRFHIERPTHPASMLTPPPRPLIDLDSPTVRATILRTLTNVGTNRDYLTDAVLRELRELTDAPDGTTVEPNNKEGANTP